MLKLLFLLLLAGCEGAELVYWRRFPVKEIEGQRCYDFETHEMKGHYCLKRLDK